MTEPADATVTLSHRCAAPPKLVFRFGVPRFDPGMTLVTVDNQPDGDGCILTPTHGGVLPDYVEGSHQGWTRILAGLLPACEGLRAADWR